MLSRGVGQYLRRQSAHAAFGAVSHDGIADLAAGGKAYMNDRVRRVGSANLQNKAGRNPSFSGCGNGKKVGAFA